nr:PREDICTED: uncharacterized protein LOC100877339 isoform X6 [Megachile rotundata]
MRADRGPENGMGLFFYNFGGDQLHRFTRLYLQRLQKQLPPDVAFPCNVTDNKLSNTTLEVREKGNFRFIPFNMEYKRTTS